jgi:hypothetical protein
MMKREQFDQLARAFWKRQPFRPFVIEYEDGERFVVTQPDAFGCYAGSATLFHPDGSLDIIDSENVSRIVELAETASP